MWHNLCYTMNEALLNRKFYRFLKIVALWCILATTGKVSAQNIANPGDALFVSMDMVNKVVEFTPLVDIEAGAKYFIVVSSWDGISDTWVQHTEIDFVADSTILAGNVIGVHLDDNLNLDPGNNYEKIQLFAQSDGARVLMHALTRGNYKTTDENPAETDSLTVYLGEATAYNYYIRNGVSGTKVMLKDMINNVENWVASSSEFSQLSSGFSILEPPVILFGNSSATIGDDVESYILDVLIYEHDGSKLTVNVELDSLASTMESEELGGFTSKQLNFSGIIGNEAISIELPLELNELKSLRKTGVFTLAGLSEGNYGDFATHTLIIKNSENLSINLRLAEINGNTYVLLYNYGANDVDISGWTLTKNGKKLALSAGSFIRSRESIIISSVKLDGKIPRDDDLTVYNYKKSAFLTKGNGQIILKSAKGTEIDEINYREKQQNSKLGVTTGAISSNVININTFSPTTSASELKKAYKPGWYNLYYSDERMDEYEGLELYYWSEKQSAYLKMDEIPPLQKIDNIMAYFDENSVGRLEELASVNKLVPENTLEFILSATDYNENGIIDNAEGINKTINNTQSFISAESLYQSIEEQGLNIDRRNILLFEMKEGETRLLTEDEFIGPGQVFWIKLSALLKETRIQVDLDSLSPIEEKGTVYDDMNGFVLELTGRDRISSVQVLFAESDDTFITPDRQTLDNFAELGLPAKYTQSLVLMDGTAPLTTLVLNEEEERILAFPLSILGIDNVDFMLRVTDKNYLPDNYEIILEDTYENRIYDLRNRVEISFKNDESSILDNNINKINGREEDLLFKETRFILKFVPSTLSELLQNSELPKTLELYQNYPNPFNPHTTISFYLPEDGDVKLSIYNVVGQPIADLIHTRMNRGEHKIDWDATDIPSGMYIYQLEVGTKIMTRKMTIVK